MQARVCATLSELVSELTAGAGALMLAEEAVESASFGALQSALAAQEPWSDIPVIVLARTGADSSAIARMMDEVANITVIERPMRISALVSVTRSALRARRRQYEVRALLQGLHEADQRKTEFLATLAHELRNPLAPLSNALALLEQAPSPYVDPPRLHSVMRRQIDHMTRLISDLMEVSRITRNKIHMQRVPVSLDQVISDAVSLSKPHLEAAGHRLHVDLPGEHVVVRGDTVRLTQIFANLLNNAAKYTPAGGDVGISAACEESHAVVTVSDSGIGIEPKMLNAIFDMFVQIGSSERQAQGGLGIGLTLVKSLVELHGGTVSAHSEGLGRGASFTVRLPRLPRQEPSPAGRPRSGDHRLGLPAGLSILIVDDNRDAADSLADLLRSLGAESVTAYRAAEALALVDQHHFDVAILDIGMPQMDGCELAQQLRRRREGAHLLLIALTGWGQPQDQERIARAGFDHHVLKPIDVNKLLALIQQPSWHGRRTKSNGSAALS
jgi:signal transduction histidine kinase/ActR/RegA family two-component response regulator